MIHGDVINKGEFSIYKNWTLLIGSEPNKQGGVDKMFCPFCHAERKSQKGRREKTFRINIVNNGGSFKCFHCGVKGYVNSIAFGGTKYERPEKLIESQDDARIIWERIYASRGIKLDTAAKYAVTFAQHSFRTNNDDAPFAKKPARCFPYIIEGRIVTYKYRSPDKDMSRFKGSALVYGGIDLIPREAKTLIIAEGEEDLLIIAQALSECKIHDVGVITVPNGVSKNMDFLFHDLSFHYAEARCADDCNIILALDDDEAGRDAIPQFASRIGEERIKSAKYNGCKDPNDLYKRDGAKALITCLLDEATPFPQKEVVLFSDILGDILEAQEKGKEPFCRIALGRFDNHFSFKRGGQSTLIAAPRQTAKSEFSFNVAVRLAVLHGFKFAVYSPETGDSEEIYEAILEVLSGKYVDKKSEFTNAEQITKEEIAYLRPFIESHFFVINPRQLGDFSTSALLDTIQMMKRKYGINSYIIDPVNSIPNFFSGDNIAIGLVDTLSQITAFNYKHDLHGIFVAHPSSVDDTKMMTIRDIFGGSAWGARMDNIMFMRRIFDTSMPALGEGDELEIFIDKCKKRHAGKRGSAGRFAYHIGSRNIGVSNSDIGGESQFLNYDKLLQLKLDNSSFDDDLPFKTK